MRSTTWTTLALGLTLALPACVSDAGGDKDAGSSSSDGGGQVDANTGGDAFVESDAGYGPAISGLGVSLDHLLDFFGDRRGVLVWVNAGGQIEMLDFRGDDPSVVTLVSSPDSVNPIISPDGTRLVYSQGMPNGPKQVLVRTLDPQDPSQLVGIGDIGYWHVDSGGDEHIVYCDWSVKTENGADGESHSQKLVTGSTDLDGSAVVIHDRAMDAGPNADLTWLGQVYNNLWAYDLANSVDYPTSSFFLQDGAAADHQTCNGSMAPDGSARLMALVIPHDWIRVYSYDSTGDRFNETSRYNLPDGMVEWEFPEWSSDPDFFSAVLMASDYRKRLFVVKAAAGELVPERVEITDDTANVTYSHLWLAP